MRIPPAAWSLFLLLLLGLAAFAFYAAQPRSDRAPEFRLPTTDNRTFALSEHRGRIVVIDFFATYCADCRIIEQNVRRAATEWDAGNVTIVSIGVAPFETLDDLREYQVGHNLSWPVAQDTQGVASAYGVYELGRVVVVDAFGTIVFAKSGSYQITTDALREVVTASLDQRGAPVKLAQWSIQGLAIVSGFAAFFSPCGIGLLPGYVGHALRDAHQPGSATRHGLRLGLLSAFGLLLVFLGIGGLALLVGKTLTRFVPWFGPLIGLVLILVGLLLVLRPYSLQLQRFFSPLTNLASAPDAPTRGASSYFLYGVGYGAGAAGCTTPVLLSLVGTAASFGIGTVGVALALYATTAALLMVVVTLLVVTSREGAAAWIQRNGRRVEVASACLFAAGGAFLLWYAARAETLPF